MRSLSARLLILTILFVMIAEVLIFVPSVARFRYDWLNQRLGAAHLAILTLDVAPERMIDDRLREELLAHVGTYAINVHRGGARLVLADDTPPPIQETVNLDASDTLQLLTDALAVLARTDARVLRVIGPSPKDAKTIIEVVIEERPLQKVLIQFAWRIFLLSLVISLFTAGLVYLSLHWLMVRPMRRITESMTRFRDDPDNAANILEATDRPDEIGVAQRELAEMQGVLRAALHQKDRLATLGTGVAKISHDLRGILSSALVVSDRLEGSEDPEVRRVTPTLISAIDRAVTLCNDTLDYVRRDQVPDRPVRFALSELIADVGLEREISDGNAFRIENRIEPGQAVTADRNQIFRVLSNLVQNAVEAGATKVTIDCEATNSSIDVLIRDNGTGLPQRARDKLFLPFEGSVRAGGTGLGLPTARELMRRHGGDLTLVESCEKGTTFRLSFPVR
jgi:signal transduction histidine kinase